MKACTIIVLYHPDKAHLTHVLALLRNDSDVVLVDNSPEKLTLTLASNERYFHLPENLGIGQAQNIGLEYAQREGYDTALLLDQDSQVTADLHRKLRQDLTQAKQLFGNVAAIGPQIVCEFSDKKVKPSIQKCVQARDGFEQVQQIIASGKLIDLKLLTKIGVKDSNLFIDGVDHEWCWRAISKGYIIVKSTNTEMLHRQGDGRVRFCGVTFKQGAPIRLYYQFRNVLLLLRRPYVPLYWKYRNLLALPVRALANGFLFSNGRMRAHFMLKGLVDGVKGRTGPYDTNK